MNERRIGIGNPFQRLSSHFGEVGVGIEDSLLTAVDQLEVRGIKPTCQNIAIQVAEATHPNKSKPGWQHDLQMIPLEKIYGVLTSLVHAGRLTGEVVKEVPPGQEKVLETAVFVFSRPEQIPNDQISDF